MSESGESKELCHCGFCGKSNEHPEVGMMIAGVNTAICDKCLAFCFEVVTIRAAAKSKTVHVCAAERAGQKDGENGKED